MGNCCGKILQEILVGNCCRKFLWEIVAGQGRGEKANLRKAVIGGNLAFGIGWWGDNQSGSSLENLAGKSCGKILWEIVVGKSCRKLLRKILQEILWEILQENLAGNPAGKSCGKCCGKFPIPISKPFLKVIFKICNSSRST